MKEEQAMAFSTLAVQAVEDITIVRVLEHRIFLKIADHFRDEIVQLIEGGAQKVIVDLSTVNVMNSSGLGVLILARDMLLKKGGVILLCGLVNIMKEIFTRMHLDDFFTIYPDCQTALAEMKKA